jgi:hypothetical protein
MGPDDISRFHQILEVFFFVTYQVKYIFVVVVNPLFCLAIFQARMREVNRNGKVPKYVRRIELVQKRSVMYYQQQTSHPFLKIVVALPTMVTSCRGKSSDTYKSCTDMKFPKYFCVNDLHSGKYVYSRIITKLIFENYSFIHFHFLIIFFLSQSAIIWLLLGVNIYFFNFW